MKSILLFIFLVIFCVGVHAQNCSVNISGGNCTGAELSAQTSGGKLAKLTWFRYGGYVYGADTISFQSGISVVAGNHGSGGSSNQLGFPAGGIFVDAQGNIYIADATNNRVQKWAPGAASGITVAGGNGSGSGDNQLTNPRDVFVDASGNIYVADGANHRIQKWAPGATSGVTVAGGNGTGSSPKQLNGPRGVYVDSNGDIYIADTYNYRIQKWKAGANKGTTVAGGNGSGTNADQFSFPIDVYLDAAKNVYIADANLDASEHHRVQKWAPGATSGVTVAGDNGVGTGANQFGYLLGIYVAADGTVYAADNGVDGNPVGRVQRWLPGAESGVTVAGGHTGGWDVLYYPRSVSLDTNGLIYVYDNANNPRVQRYIPTNGIVNRKFSPSGAGLYTAEAVFKNGCTATSNTLNFYSVPEIYKIYPTHAKGRSNLCSGGIDTFFVNPWDDITDYTWKIPAECSLISDRNDSIILSIPEGFSSGKLIAQGTNMCGTGEPDTLRLLGKPLSPGGISGLRRVYTNQSNIIYSVKDKNDINLNHNWTVPQDAVIQSGQGTSSITVQWGSTAGTVAVNSYNDCGASHYTEIQVSLRNGFSAGEKKIVEPGEDKRNHVIVFPNPAKDIATIQFTSPVKSNHTIELQDITGKTLVEKEFFASRGVNTIKLDVSKYAKGIYLINIKNSETRISVKLIKQ